MMFTADSLFVERTPTAAAIQLATVLADAAETLLAIAEETEKRKGEPEYRRQQYNTSASIYARQCIDMKVAPRGLLGRDCKRLAQYMADVEANKARVARRAEQQSSGDTAEPKA